MTRNPRVKVHHFEERPNLAESKHLFPVCATAYLECGHAHNIGVSTLRPKRMACDACGLIQRLQVRLAGTVAERR